MFSQTQLRTYAERLYMDSDLFSCEEKAAEMVLNLLGHGHGVEGVKEWLVNLSVLASLDGDGPLAEAYIAVVSKISRG